MKDANGDVFALSNNHVYAATNSASINPGDPVIQPGTYDGGSWPADYIGDLADFQQIIFGGSDNTIDAAIAEITFDDFDGDGDDEFAVGNATPSDGYGTPKSGIMDDPSVGLRVRKYGRTTGQTNGRIDAINATVNVNYGASNGVALFTGQIIIKPGNFSAGGDSGSLIVVQKGTDARSPVGLLFAGGFGITVANPIDAVLEAFGVTIDGN